MIFFGGNKRPKGGEDLSAFVKRRMKEIEIEEERKKKGTVMNVRKKGFIEQTLIREGYWPEEDNHHDIIRLTLIKKGTLIGFYIASICMLIYIYYLFILMCRTSGENPAYNLNYQLPVTIHNIIAEYVFILPLLIILLYRLIWIHTPRFLKLSWTRVIAPEKKKWHIPEKYNKFINYYIILCIIVLYPYGKLLTIELNTLDLEDLLYIYNSDYQPLFHDWEKFILKSVGLWFDMEVTYEAKYYSCVKFILDDLMVVPEPVKNPYNPRVGIGLDRWLHIKIKANPFPEEVFFGKCDPNNPGKIPELFQVLRTEGPEVGRVKFKELYKEEIQQYNQGMKEIQIGICNAYGHRKPLVAGQFPFSMQRLYQPYPKEWLKEMAEGKR